MSHRKRILLLACLLVAGCMDATEQSAPSVTAEPAIKKEIIGDPVEGLRVATRVGCNGCHTANGGGKVFVDEPGSMRIVAANLTERRSLYDDAGLEALIRHGKTQDGHRPLGMPIKMFQYLSDREILDITAWLRSLPAVSNPDLPAGMLSDTIKKQLAEGTFPFDDDVPDPIVQSSPQVPTETLALGKHIAMTTCPECHGPDLNGFPEDGTPPLIIAKAYSAENFARLMKEGITAEGKESKSGLMSKVAKNRFSVMTETEVKALKAYLDSR